MHFKKKVVALFLTMILSFQIVQNNNVSAVEQTAYNLGNSFSSIEKTELIKNLKNITKKQGIGGSFKNTFSVEEAVNTIIEELDNAIANQSNMNGISKELIAAVIFREMLCYDVFDHFGDGIISSTIGISQISAEGIQQNEKVVCKKEVTKPIYQDYSDKELKKLLNDPIASVGFVVLALKARAYQEHIPLQTTTEKQIEKIFSDYNDYCGEIPVISYLSSKIGLNLKFPEIGSVQYKGTYGKQTYEYYEQFMLYYNSVPY